MLDDVLQLDLTEMAEETPFYYSVGLTEDLLDEDYSQSMPLWLRDALSSSFISMWDAIRNSEALERRGQHAYVSVPSNSKLRDFDLANAEFTEIDPSEFPLSNRDKRLNNPIVVFLLELSFGSRPYYVAYVRGDDALWNKFYSDQEGIEPNLDKTSLRNILRYTKAICYVEDTAWFTAMDAVATKRRNRYAAKQGVTQRLMDRSNWGVGRYDKSGYERNYDRIRQKLVNKRIGDYQQYLDKIDSMLRDMGSCVANIISRSTPRRLYQCTTLIDDYTSILENFADIMNTIDYYLELGDDEELKKLIQRLWDGNGVLTKLYNDSRRLLPKLQAETYVSID